MMGFGRSLTSLRTMVAAVLMLAALGVGGSLAAQEHGGTGDVARDAVAPTSQHEASENQIDIVHHIGDSHELETPFGLVHLPRWAPVHIGGITLDFSPTKHLVYMLLAAILVALVFLLSARSVAREQARGRPAKGFAGSMEALALYIRQEVVLPNVGHHGEGYAPYLLTLFFFILAMNLLGLLPWGATATGNIAVTAALAVMAFGIGGTILKVVLLAVMTPIELIGKLAKPFALAVRLFANMTSGHVLVLALIGLTFLFKSYAVGIGASLLATGVMILELFVAFLQAFVFTLLTSVFIGLMRAEH